MFNRCNGKYVFAFVLAALLVLGAPMAAWADSNCCQYQKNGTLKAKSGPNLDENYCLYVLNGSFHTNEKADCTNTLCEVKVSGDDEYICCVDGVEDPKGCTDFPVCGDGVVDIGEQCDGDAGACPGKCLDDCTCEVHRVPTLPQWGLIGLGAVLFVGGALVFRRRRAHA